MEIRELDIVQARFVEGRNFYGKVLHRPTDVGDMWHIEVLDIGDVWAINPMCSDFVGLVKYGEENASA